MLTLLVGISYSYFLIEAFFYFTFEQLYSIYFWLQKENNESIFFLFHLMLIVKTDSYEKDTLCLWWLPEQLVLSGVVWKNNIRWKKGSTF